MIKLKPLPSLMAAVSSLVVSVGASAQAAQDDSARSALTLEEVVVTATKRETSLMDTPVAVTAFNQEALTRAGINDVTGMSAMVPNFKISVDGFRGAAQLGMRGVASTNFTEVGDPNVGFHVDGVYVPRPEGALTLMYDLERAEVLRGPQGTLFGRNSTVGAINLITAKPDFSEFYGNVQAELGNYQHKQLRGTLNIPITDTFAIRLNGFANQRDAYQTVLPDLSRLDQRRAVNYGKSDRYSSKDQWAARLSALWTPTDDFSWQIALERFQNNNPGAIPAPDCNKLAGTADACGDIDTFTANTTGATDMRVDSFRSMIKYSLTDSMELSYNVGYSTLDRFQQVDTDLGVGTDQTFQNTSDFESNSHELQLQSVGDGNLEWTVGLFHFEEDNWVKAELDRAYFRTNGVDADNNPIYEHMGLRFLQPERTATSDAAFVQGTYSFTDQLRLTLGYRYTKDEKEDVDGGNYICGPTSDINGCYLQGEPVPSLTNGVFSGEPFPRLTDNSVKGEWSKGTYRVGLDYDLNATTLLYAVYATGFKGGVFTDVVTIRRTGERIDVLAGPEEVGTFEIGMKGSFLDGSMNLNAALFFSDYSDMQVTTNKNFGPERDPLPGEDPATIPDQTQLVTENAGESSINGLEVEVDWIPVENGRLTGYVSWLDAEVDDWVTKNTNFCGPRYGSAGCPEINLKGNKLPRAPEFAFTVAYEHTFYLGNGSKLIPWVSYHWEDDQYLQAFNVGTVTDLDTGELTDRYSDEIDAFETVDASLRYESADDKWFVSLYGNNLTDERVNTLFRRVGNVMFANYTQPRTYGLRFGYNW